MSNKIVRILILDEDVLVHASFDRRLSSAHRTHAYTDPMAVASLENSPPFDIVFLGTGLEVARYIAHELHPNQQPAHVWIHSVSATDRLKMARVLKGAGIPVTVQRWKS